MSKLWPRTLGNRYFRRHGRAGGHPRHHEANKNAGAISSGVEKFANYRLGYANADFTPAIIAAACAALRNRHAIVIGPTPPGTGVMAPATFAHSS